MRKHFSYLDMALKLAEIRRGFCAPNPSVGAVVVKNEVILASGYHWAAGQPHAEVDALAQLSPEQSQNATLYVTLEPCCHWGRTPPCIERIIASRIKGVFYGYQDPNPVVAGKGANILQQSGISCQRLPHPAINDFYRSYCYWQMYNLPKVTAKIALSLDGKIAGCGGETIAITGEQLKQFTHEQRKKHDAILTSVATINRDDPQLNVRFQQQTFAKPIYVLDSHLSLSLKAKIFTTAARLVIFHRAEVDPERLQQLQKLGVECITVDHAENGLNLLQVLQRIGAQGIHDLWIEAGGKCFQAFLKAGLVQRALIYLAPKILGNTALSAFDSQQDILVNVKNIHWQSFGHDTLCQIDYDITPAAMTKTAKESELCLPA